jgi:hypothetical protein
VIEQQDLEARLAAVLEPEGYPFSPTGSGLAGWKVFLFQGLGEAAIMWGRPDDRENAEAGVQRDIDDHHLRMERLEGIQSVLQTRGYTCEVAYKVGQPRVTITRVPA